MDYNSDHHQDNYNQRPSMSKMTSLGRLIKLVKDDFEAHIHYTPTEAGTKDWYLL